MRTSRTSLLLGLAVATVLLVTGCSSDKKAATTTEAKPTTPATDTSTTTAATSTTATTKPASTTTTTAASTTTTTAPDANPARCKVAQLNITAGQPAAATGHQGVAIIWQNSSSTPCLMTGWAGADGLDANGASATHAVRTDSGFLGGISDGSKQPAVVLRPGDSASSMVEGTSVPVGNATSCPTYSGLLVTPPEDTTSVKLDVTLPGCSGLQIHPVVAGTTGRVE